MFQKLHESIVQDFIYDLEQDKIFVEWKKNKIDIKGFAFNDNGLSILKQTEFTIYVKSNNTYTIRYDFFKHKHIESVTELYRLAQEKLNNPDYKGKADKRRKELKSKQLKDYNYHDVDVGIRNAWNIPAITH